MKTIAQFTAMPPATAREKLVKLRKAREDITREINGLAVHALKELCEDIFHGHPDLESFAWVQYGGEYNDEGPYPGINNVCLNNSWDEESPNFADSYSLIDSSPGDAVTTEIKDRLQDELGTDVLLDVLNDYPEGSFLVEVTREGITVDSWDRY